MPETVYSPQSLCLYIPTFHFHSSISDLIQFSVKRPPVIICKLCTASLAECARFIWWCPCMEAKFQSKRFNCGTLIAVVLEGLAGLSFQSPFCLLKRFAFDTHKWVDSPWRRRATVGDLQQEKHWWRQDTKDSFPLSIPPTHLFFTHSSCKSLGSLPPWVALWARRVESAANKAINWTTSMSSNKTKRNSV